MDSTEDRFVVLFSILMSGSWYLPSGCSPLILNIFITDVWRPPEKKQFRCSPAGRSTACTRDIHHHWDHILIVERVFRMNLDLETYRWRTQQRMLTCGGKMAFPHLCYFNFFFFFGSNCYSNWWGKFYVMTCEKRVWTERFTTLFCSCRHSWDQLLQTSYCSLCLPAWVLLLPDSQACLQR